MVYGCVQGFRSGAADGSDLEYARMCGDVRRFGNFGAEVPEIAEAGSIPRVAAAAQPESAAA